MELFSVIGIVILAILALYLSKVIGIVMRVALAAAIVVLILVFFFGVSMDQVLDWAAGVVLWAF